MQSAGAWSCGGGYCGQGQVGRTVKAGWPQGNLPLRVQGPGANPSCGKRAGRLSHPRLLPRLPVSPGFSRRKMGCPSGGGAPGRGSRAVTCPLSTPPPLRRSSNQSAPGGSSRAGTTRLGGGGWVAVTWTARPAPASKGRGSVCSVTNGPPAPLARSLGLGADSAREHPPAGCRRPAALPGAGRRSSANPREGAPGTQRGRLARGGRPGRPGPRRRAACLPAGECAVWAGMLRGECRATCEPSAAGFPRVRAMRRLSLQS